MLTVFRKEIKYVIPICDYLKIKGKLEALLNKDKYGENGVYTVRSQYFDSITDCDLNDNLAGVMEKRKIRLRIYSPEDKNVKLEYKCKSNTDSVKQSLIITRQEAEYMQNHEYSFLLGYNGKLANQMYVRLNQGGYRPKTIVEYTRTAYSHPTSDIRITFDTNTAAMVNPYGFFDKDLNLTPVLHPDVGVLEIKYNDFLPSVFKEIIQTINASPQANSKYSQARLRFLF